MRKSGIKRPLELYKKNIKMFLKYVMGGQIKQNSCTSGYGPHFGSCKHSDTFSAPIKARKYFADS